MFRPGENTTMTVYGVSVDSRSRPASQPDNKYDVDLGIMLDRVKTIQLGSIQIPDCRYAFGKTSQLQYSEPMNIEPDCHLFVEQTTTTLNKLTCLTTVDTRQIQLLVPPTLNKITGYSAPSQVTTEFDHGLEFGASYYSLVNLQMQVVGADFPQTLMTVPMPAPFPTRSGPVLATSTLTAPPYVGPANEENVYTYAAGYMDALTSSAGNYDDRHLLAANYCSYVHAPKPTLVELFVMLNAALNDKVGVADVVGTTIGATNAGPIEVTTAAPHGLQTADQIVVDGVLGNTAANGTFLITVTGASTFTLNNSSGNGAYAGGGAFTSPQGLALGIRFGFDDETNSIIATSPTRVSESRSQTKTVSTRLVGPAGSLAAKLGFGTARLDPPARADVPASVLRTVDIRQGNYTAKELADVMNIRMNPLAFLEEDSDTRTLRYSLPGGTSANLVIPRGRYTGAQLAGYLTAHLSPGPAQITVEYDADVGRFTFAHTLGMVFGLNFTAQNDADTAARLGFSAVNYDGASSYTSVDRAVFGVASTATFPANNYSLSTDAAQQHFTFDTGDPLQFLVDGGTNTAGVGAVWDPTCLCAGAGDAGFAGSFQPGDILHAQFPIEQNIDVVGATNASPVEITTTANHGLTTGDNVTVSCVEGNEAANGTWTVTVTSATTFTSDGSSGSGTYVGGGSFASNFLAGGGDVTNTFTVVVQSAWDASTGVPLLTLEPTASIFSVISAGNDAVLGQPTATTHRLLLRSAHRNAFQLHFAHPASAASNFGFPTTAWPPTANALQQFDSEAFPTYDPSCVCVPVSSSYTSPYCWNLSPPDYIVMVLKEPNGSPEIHTHSFRGDTRAMFAKLYITQPFVSISEQMLFATFANLRKLSSVSVEFQNPDGTLVEFNGRAHNFTLLFTLLQENVEGVCL
jgi:hypothetical protein